MIDPVGTHNSIRDYFISYIETAFRIRNKGVSQERRDLFKQTNALCSDPLIEPVPFYEGAHRLHELRDENLAERFLPGMSTEGREAFIQLALCGLVDSDISSDGSAEGRHKLYNHQLEMMRKGLGKCTPGIVTSGTGSGKTESFLLPIIAKIANEAVGWEKPSVDYLQRRWWWDDQDKPCSKYKDLPNRPTKSRPNDSPFVLHREGESKNRPKAVRALILYPMNALVEDQLTRIRSALDSPEARTTCNRLFNGNRIFFGSLTSNTPVTGYHIDPRPGDDEVDRRIQKLKELHKWCIEAEETQRVAKAALENDSSIDPNPVFLFPATDGAELNTRWDIQDTPPDLLITNISMLSAVLARQVDASIIEHTKKWIEEDEDAYFYLVLDELHLHRGTSGTEVSHLLRVLLTRLGLHKPEHRHKLRILASSASLPVEGKLAELSGKYLYDMFGSYGIWDGQSDKPDSREWLKAIVQGTIKRSSLDRADFAKIAPEPFIELSRLYETEAQSVGEGHEIWDRISREVIGKLGINVSGDSAIQKAIWVCSELTMALCYSENGEGYRATKFGRLKDRLFGQEHSEQALRGWLLVSSAPDWLRHSSSDIKAAHRFRIHMFFKSQEGLFASVGSDEGVREAYKTEDRTIGPLSSEKGLAFDPSGADGVKRRMLELLYCEACGELFVGGNLHKSDSGYELSALEANIDQLPEASSDDRFENLSIDDFGLFYPDKPKRTPTKPKASDKFDDWKRAELSPKTGLVKIIGRFGGKDPKVVQGYFYRRKGKLDSDKTGTGMCVPYGCPSCGESYVDRGSFKKVRGRLSPIRNFRTGFGKTTQLMASELFRVVSELDSPKLVSFSDSRQDAARAALDVEMRNYDDLLRFHFYSAAKEALSSARGIDYAKEISFLHGDLKRYRTQGRHKLANDTELKLSHIKKSQWLSEMGIVPVAEVVGNYHSPADYAYDEENGESPGLRPLIHSFALSGVHPFDPAGIKKIESNVNDQEKKVSHPWHYFYSWDRVGQPHWKDDDTEKERLNEGRKEILKSASTQVVGFLFNKTYFSCEETGLGFPCVLQPHQYTLTTEDEIVALLRVLGDSSRVQESKYYDKTKQSWAADGVPKNSRLYQFAKAVSESKGCDLLEYLSECHEILGAEGHTGFVVRLRGLGFRIAEPQDPYWRCGNCGRVHLVLGAGVCTRRRCHEALPPSAAPSGTVAELQSDNFVAKRVVDKRDIKRLRAEELTGQTDRPADRQRRFRGIILGQTGKEVTPELNLISEIDVLAVTTTMEVGVDIGSLRSVFQSNMPPQRFNYQQRVGRAGRRGSAYSSVLTLCRSRSHDLYYYRYPEKITGDQPPPPFLSKNQVQPAIRFLRKEALRIAFSKYAHECALKRIPFSGDKGKDVHGDYGTHSEFVNEDAVFESICQIIAGIDSEIEELKASLTEDSALAGFSEIKDFDSSALIKDLQELRNKEPQDEGLGKVAADHGFLPLYGMPTRVKRLYTGAILDETNNKNRTDWEDLDRDIETSIFEFAPQNRLVKDKMVHTSMGIAGTFPRRGNIYGKVKTSHPYSEHFYLVVCEVCYSPQTVSNNSGQQQCRNKNCGAMLDLDKATLCIVPVAYLTDFNPKHIDDVDGMGPSFVRHLSAEEQQVGLESLEASNLQVGFTERSRTYKVNCGYPIKDQNGRPGLTLTAKEMKLPTKRSDGGVSSRNITLDVALIDESVPDKWQVSSLVHGRSIDHDLSRVWLASPKTTNSVLITPAKINRGLNLNPLTDGKSNTARRAAALSALTILTQRAAKDFDVDPEEFEILAPRIWYNNDGANKPLLQIADTLLNGSGLSQRLAEQAGDGWFLDELIRDILSNEEAYPLSELLSDTSIGKHVKVCDKACYHCLNRYSNRTYHGLLDWRLGLSYLRALYDPNYSCGLDGRYSSFKELEDWPALSKTYASFMADLGGDGETEQIGDLSVFRFDRESRWYLIVHPLWQIDGGDYPDELINAIFEFGHDCLPVDTFELARRPITTRSRLMKS